MTIDPIKLKAAAEHLEWVLEQYPDDPTVQNMLEGLRPLIEGAKAGEVKEVVESIPFGYSFSEGAYRPYKHPNVEDAYVSFATEMEGGLTEQDKRLNARIEEIRKEIRPRDEP